MLLSHSKSVFQVLPFVGLFALLHFYIHPDICRLQPYARHRRVRRRQSALECLEKHLSDLEPQRAVQHADTGRMHMFDDYAKIMFDLVVGARLEKALDCIRHAHPESILGRRPIRM
jgi:hypothetical protein